MKTIIVALLITLLPIGSFSQIAQKFNSNNSSDKCMKSSLIYSEDDDALVFKNGVSVSSKEIIIENIPFFDQASIPVYINQEVNGNYTFKKHPALMLPEFYTVIIEDTATGNRFDLKTSDSYSFDIEKNIPERFILQIHKLKTTMTAMR